MAANQKRELPVVNANVNADGVGRREILQGLFAGVGAGVALPAFAAHAHPAAPAVAAAEAKARATDWKAEFFDPHQLATVGALCARIVPGSEKAQTDRFIDSLLAVDSRERQGRFMRALGGIEGASMAKFQRPFKSLGAAQQVELLTIASGMDSGYIDWVWTPGEVLQRPERGAETPTLRDHFDHIKAWVVECYYSSEAGLKELGSTGQMFFATFPDCEHPEHR